MPQGTGEPGGDDGQRLNYLRQRVAEVQAQLDDQKKIVKRVRTKIVELRRGTKDMQIKEILIDLIDIIDEEREA